ncbi:MAG: hypothetical protein MRY64_14910 [Hyphomonadaceae bacterium]|nr:hypothetical protein [Hyphomonadaceae bacterium]
MGPKKIAGWRERKSATSDSAKAETTEGQKFRIFESNISENRSQTRNTIENFDIFVDPVQFPPITGDQVDVFPPASPVAEPGRDNDFGAFGSD